jgi:hypothetical protein
MLPNRISIAGCIGTRPMRAPKITSVAAREAFTVGNTPT